MVVHDDTVTPVAEQLEFIGIHKVPSDISLTADTAWYTATSVEEWAQLALSPSLLATFMVASESVYLVFPEVKSRDAASY